jgi:phage gpG-like protein
MFGVKITTQFRPKQVEHAQKKGAFKSMLHAARAIRKTAVESMVFAKGPSRPGQPPHAHTGRLRRSILYTVDNDDAFVGVSYARARKGDRPEWLARMLEKGGVYGRPRKGKQKREAATGRFAKGFEKIESPVTYPARPFMHPALERNLARFHREWQGAI